MFYLPGASRAHTQTHTLNQSELLSTAGDLTVAQANMWLLFSFNKMEVSDFWHWFCGSKTARLSLKAVGWFPHPRPSLQHSRQKEGFIHNTTMSVLVPEGRKVPRNSLPPSTRTQIHAHHMHTANLPRVGHPLLGSMTTCNCKGVWENEKDKLLRIILDLTRLSTWA